jgi:hypothetical protein
MLVSVDVGQKWLLTCAFNDKPLFMTLSLGTIVDPNGALTCGYDACDTVVPEFGRPASPWRVDAGNADLH